MSGERSGVQKADRLERSRSRGVYPAFCSLPRWTLLLLLGLAFGEQSVLITVLCCLLLVVNSNCLSFPFSWCLFLPPLPTYFLDSFSRSRTFPLYSPHPWFFFSTPPSSPLACAPRCWFLCSHAHCHPVLYFTSQQLSSQVPEHSPVVYGTVESTHLAASTPVTATSNPKQGLSMDISYFLPDYF